MKAGYLVDVLEGGQPIRVESSGPKSFQKSGKENVCFSGADVVSLFPSLRRVEAARLARYIYMYFTISIL